MTQKRWIWIRLAALVIAGGLLRFRHIADNAPSYDDLWAVFLATGRGDITTTIPSDVIMDPPPEVWFENAPPIWRIWLGMGGETHPPGYPLLLRAWIDIFGSGDGGVRALSAVLSLGSIVLIFQIIRRQGDLKRALIAAAMMTFAVSQIQFSQMSRPYILLVFLGLVMIGIVLEIERNGAKLWRLLFLGAACYALAITHYFSAGALLGMGFYSLIRLRGWQRRRVISAFVSALAIYLFTWGPFLAKTMHDFTFYQTQLSQEGGTTLGRILWVDAISAPANLLVGPLSTGLGIHHADAPMFFTIMVAVLVYVVPLLSDSREKALIWWCWLVGGVLLFLAADIHSMASRPPLLGASRYAMILMPGICGLIALPVSRCTAQMWMVISLFAWIAPLVVLAVAVEGAPFFQKQLFLIVGGAYDQWAAVLLVVIGLAAVLALRKTAHKRRSLIWIVAAIISVTFSVSFAQAFLVGFNLIAMGLAAILLLYLLQPKSECMSWIPALAILIVVIFQGIESSQPRESVRLQTITETIDHDASPNELVVLVLHKDLGGLPHPLDFIFFEHYTTHPRRPILLLTTDTQNGTPVDLGNRRACWLMTDDPTADLKNCFPGWKITRQLPTIGSTQTVEISSS